VAIADDLVEAFIPWLTDDLEDYLRAIGSMFSEVELYAIADDDDQGWVILFDPDRCPAPALPYLAQYVGERLPVGISEAGAREWIKDAPNQRRGTIGAIWRTAQRRLTGTRTVSIIERDGIDGSDDPDRLTVITYTDETPDPAGVLADLHHDAVAIDTDLNYEVVAGQTWVQAGAAEPTWNDLHAAWPTWADVFAARTGLVFSRPRP
jgi:hypothetical protein